jgi:CHAD domain-containing protein
MGPIRPRRTHKPQCREVPKKTTHAWRLMADGKWIADLTADTPLAEAARRALKVRLHVVRDYVPLAAAEMPRDPEYVHQLRVGTRRAGAALRIFAACLPDKTRRKASRRLRRLRRAAGEARDWDVFALGLLQRLAATPSRERAGLDYLLGYAAGQRAAAQVHLMDTARKDGEDFEAFIVQTLDAVRPPDKDGDTLLTLAKPLLAQLLHELEEKANGDLTNYAHLHQVRIAGKHLRYAMELFAACFDASFKEKLYPQVEEMQEILGRANDSHVAVQRLEAIRAQGQKAFGAVWKTLRPGVTALLQFHRRQLPRERRAFLAWWDQWRKGGGPAMTAPLEGGCQS